jgi:hypothetical protein
MESVVMSILVELEKEIEELRKKVEELEKRDYQNVSVTVSGNPQSRAS